MKSAMPHYAGRARNEEKLLVCPACSPREGWRLRSVAPGVGRRPYLARILEVTPRFGTGEQVDDQRVAEVPHRRCRGVAIIRVAVGLEGLVPAHAEALVPFVVAISRVDMRHMVPSAKKMRATLRLSRFKKVRPGLSCYFSKISPKWRTSGLCSEEPEPSGRPADGAVPTYAHRGGTPPDFSHASREERRQACHYMPRITDPRFDRWRVRKVQHGEHPFRSQDVFYRPRSEVTTQVHRNHWKVPTGASSRTLRSFRKRRLREHSWFHRRAPHSVPCLL